MPFSCVNRFLPLSASAPSGHLAPLESLNAFCTLMLSPFGQAPVAAGRFFVSFQVGCFPDSKAAMEKTSMFLLLALVPNAPLVLVALSVAWSLTEQLKRSRQGHPFLIPVLVATADGHDLTVPFGLLQVQSLATPRDQSQTEPSFV
jgi:hypothetical protein